MNIAAAQTAIETGATLPTTSWVGNITFFGLGFTILLLSFLSQPKAASADGKKPARNGRLFWSPVVIGLGNRFIGEPSVRLKKKVIGKANKDASGQVIIEDPEPFDWMSLLSFFIGFIGMTSILMTSNGDITVVLDFLWSGVFLIIGFPGISDMGAGAIALILLFLAMAKQGDSKKDLVFGIVCAVFFSVAGGGFASLSNAISNWIPTLFG
jgi:hypothetical protein